jgi:sulfite exporter TauE/SafE
VNCYYHPDQPAVGLCKHCQRGLCSDCAADADGSLACKDRHEKQVRAIDELAVRNLLQAGRVGSVYRRNAIFYTLVGMLFGGFGLTQIRWLGWQGIFLATIGFFLLYAAITNYLESRKYK